MSNKPMVTRFVAAILVLLGGILHLQLWNKTYRDTPSIAPGAWVVRDGFPVNATASIILAAALVASAAGLLALAPRLIGFLALVLEGASIAALTLSRSTKGIFRWHETGWDTDAKRIIFVEVAAAIVLLIDLALQDARKAAG
ncbi:MAG TPA: hypothetical protein VGM93_04400 [Acidimicrobiales bacterium]